jgi:signal transduction histidine kinase
MLRDSVLIAAALSGTIVALVLRNETGTWYRDSNGLTSEQFEALEPLLSPRGAGEPGGALSLPFGLVLIAAFALNGARHQLIGTLYLLSPAPLTLSVQQQEGLQLLAEHIQTIVTMDHQKLESRTVPRPPAASSFVPGLVHELSSFVFGISANLDAFEARFVDLEEVTKYATNIRKSLDRMSAFIVELREYGYPQRLSWSSLELAPLLQDTVTHLLPLAAKNHLDLQLHVEGHLPAISADTEGLKAAFTRVIDLVLQLGAAGSRVLLHAATCHQGNQAVVCGYLEFSTTKFDHVDPARLFEPFYFRVSGLGRLTLPGARRVFESHGGTLSAGPGPDGSMRIRFMLPAE